MGMTTPFPEPDSPSLEPFMVYARVEIIALLQALGAHGVLTTVYFDRHAGFAVTALLAVNPDFEEVVFDIPGDPAAARRLLAADELVFVAFVESVKLQFTATRAEATLHEDKPAFRVRLPEAALRLQRRDFFRVRAPLGKPPVCLVPYSEDGKQYERLRLLDISIGGMALVSYPERFELPAGKVIGDCYLDLPGVGSVGVSMEVCHVDAMPRDEKARRCGCRFVDMAPQARMMLQRYVNKLDAEQRKAAT
jgi:c-di-GMP-binding flagellar brake protein YcgR